MKNTIYTLVFSIIAILIACQKSNYLNVKDQNNLITIERIESARRHHYQLHVNKNSLTLIKNENDTINSRKSTKEWEEIKQLVNQIQLNQLGKIKSPSQTFMHDGAANTSLVIKTKDSTYYSNPYDKGNPALELKKLDDYLTELSTSLSK